MAAKDFVINRHGRLVFPSNAWPRLDFSVFDTVGQLSAAVNRFAITTYDKRPTRWRDVPRDPDDHAAAGIARGRDRRVCLHQRGHHP
jgi:3-oxoacyl-[acyl-carrier-protein] synthase III